MYTKHPEPEWHIFYIRTSGDIVVVLFRPPKPLSVVVVLLCVEDEKAEKNLPNNFGRVKYYHSDPS